MIKKIIIIIIISNLSLPNTASFYPFPAFVFSGSKDTLRPQAARTSDVERGNMELIAEVETINHAWDELISAETDLAPAQIYREKLTQWYEALRIFTEYLPQHPEDIERAIRDRRLSLDGSVYGEVAVYLKEMTDTLWYQMQTMPVAPEKEEEAKRKINTLRKIRNSISKYILTLDEETRKTYENRAYYLNPDSEPEPMSADEAGISEEGIDALISAEPYDFIRYEPHVSESAKYGENVLDEGNGFKLSYDEIEALELFDKANVVFSLLTVSTKFGERRLEYLFTNPFFDYREIMQRQEAVEALLSKPGIRKQMMTALSTTDKYGNCSRISGLGDGRKSFLPTYFKESWPNRWSSKNAYKSDKLSILKGDPNLQTELRTYAEVYAANIDDKGKGDEEKTPEEAFLGFGSFLRCINELRDTLLGSESAKLRQIGRAFANLGDLEKTVESLNRLEELRLIKPIDSMGIRLKGGKITHVKFWPRSVFIERLEVGTQLDSFFDKKEIELFFAMQALGELDAYLSLANLSRTEGYIRPELLNPKETPAQMDIQTAHHLYIYAVNRKKSVGNSTHFDNNLSVFQVTGLQTAGKSTLGTSTALLLLLASLGSRVPAQAMKYTPMVFRPAVNLQGSQEEGISHAVAQLERGKDVLDEIKKYMKRGIPIIYIADEGFSGVNSIENVPIEIAFLIYLSSLKDVFALFATQEYEVAKAFDILRAGGSFEDVFPKQPKSESPVGDASVSEAGIATVHFRAGYKLMQGAVPPTKMNAIAIMAMLEYPFEIIEQAIELVKLRLNNMGVEVPPDWAETTFAKMKALQKAVQKRERAKFLAENKGVVAIDDSRWLLELQRIFNDAPDFSQDFASAA